MEVRRLGIDDVGLIARIDRSEHVEVEYTVVEGRLIERSVSMPDIPPWDQVGTEAYSVAAEVAFCVPLVAGRAVLLGAFEHDATPPRVDCHSHTSNQQHRSQGMWNIVPIRECSRSDTLRTAAESASYSSGRA